MKIGFTVVVAIAMFVIAGAQYASADITLFDANFDTDGDFQGFVNFQDRLSVATVAGGVFSGTGGSNNDPQLRTAAGTLAVDLSSLPDATLEIRMKNSTGESINGGLSFIEFVGATASNTAGLPVVNFNATPIAADTFEIFKFDAKAILAGLAGTDNVLRSIRFDPLNVGPVSGNTFEIDYVRFTTSVPEPTSLTLLGLGSVLTFVRRRRRA
jgi:hypothetical protein